MATAEPMRVLGIETSCDETAAAVVDGDRRIHAERILSQLDEHRPYGGIVPEIAARAHIDALDGIIAETMRRAEIGFDDLDGVAATGGPGLIGGVIVGVMTAKGIAAAMICAAQRLAAEGEDRVDLLFVVGEEAGSDGATAANHLPATSSALVTERCIEIVVEAGVLPDGVLSLICGSTGDLLGRLT